MTFSWMCHWTSMIVADVKGSKCLTTVAVRGSKMSEPYAWNWKWRIHLRRYSLSPLEYHSLTRMQRKWADKRTSELKSSITHGSLNEKTLHVMLDHKTHRVRCACQRARLPPCVRGFSSLLHEEWRCGPPLQCAYQNTHTKIWLKSRRTWNKTSPTSTKLATTMLGKDKIIAQSRLHLPRKCWQSWGMSVFSQLWD